MQGLSRGGLKTKSRKGEDTGTEWKEVENA
jgi:hypothetical protein